MLRSNPASSMQKTYDEVYLICSTAIYFEKQNNEIEAVRSWREALDQIYYHNAYKVPAQWRPKTETERALAESLRDMELQCKERVDLFDALRKSREEAKSKSNESLASINGHAYAPPSSIRQPSHNSPKPFDSQTSQLGQGTVPPSSYDSLSRPTLPQRLSTPYAQSSSSLSRSVPTSYPSTQSVPSINTISQGPRLQPEVLMAPGAEARRSPSPAGRSMLKATLRPGKKDDRVSSGKLAHTMRIRPQRSAAQAATLAWPNPNQPGLLPGPQNPSQSNITDLTNDSSRKNSLEQQRAPPYSYSSGVLRPPSPEDSPSVPTHLNANLPARPKSLEPLGPQPSTTNLADQRARSIPNKAPPPPPPHRTRQLQQQGETNSPTLAEKNSATGTIPPANFLLYRKEYPTATPMDPRKVQSISRNPPGANLERSQGKPQRPPVSRKAVPRSPKRSTQRQESHSDSGGNGSSGSEKETSSPDNARVESIDTLTAELPSENVESDDSKSAAWDARVKHLMKNLPKGVDEQAAKAIFNEVVIKGDEVHWDDVAGLDVAKTALKEAVVYPFLRPDLFLGLREPARGMLLFGPPGTGKTMLARAVATESQSTFFAISASSLTSKFLGESEKLVRALFKLAKCLTPSIIFVDEIDSLLSARGGGSEHEATRRIKTEFLIQWSDLAKAAAGREQTDGDASRVLVLAATNLPWAIDEAARRRFVRRQYIPLPEDHVRESQLRRLMGAQKHDLQDGDYTRLIELTDGFSGSDITALAKDAAMGPLRSLGEELLHMTPDQIRPIKFIDFEASLITIRPSVSKQGLKQFEDWAKEFGERGG